jgi:hypothetical protein
MSKDQYLSLPPSSGGEKIEKKPFDIDPLRTLYFQIIDNTANQNEWDFMLPKLITYGLNGFDISRGEVKKYLKSEGITLLNSSLLNQPTTALGLLALIQKFEPISTDGRILITEDDKAYNLNMFVETLSGGSTKTELISYISNIVNDGLIIDPPCEKTLTQQRDLDDLLTSPTEKNVEIIEVPQSATSGEQEKLF